MNAQLRDLVDLLPHEEVSEARKALYTSLQDILRQRIQNSESVSLLFVCTHNSRRSHLAQIWARTMAAYFGQHRVECYSAGTEATAMYPLVAETLSSQGFEVNPLTGDPNPLRSIRYSSREYPIISFSKTLDHPFLPKSNFETIMVCSAADAACPYVPGASSRHAITFEDPKVYDGTPEASAKYVERSLQIATEMKYLFSPLGI